MLRKSTLFFIFCTLCSYCFSALAEAEERQLRIVGGDAIEIQTVPSTVALIDNTTFSFTGSYTKAMYCGGTLIAPKWVLTAAHCLVNTYNNTRGSGTLSVLTDSTHLENVSTTPIPVTRIITHESYNANAQDFDIALLELEYAASSPTSTLNQSAIADNVEGYIAGWGAVSSAEPGETSTISPQLRGAQVLMLSGERCAALFPALANRYPELQLCAGLQEGGVDTCQGDSGGPLYRVTTNNTLELAGITSWGYQCALPNSPGVYTDVLAFKDWITAHSEGATFGAVDTSSDVPIETPENLPLVSTQTNETAQTTSTQDGGQQVNHNSTTTTTTSVGSLSWFSSLLFLGSALLRRKRQRNTNTA